jgi:predicted nucleotidyltransferase
VTSVDPARTALGIVNVLSAHLAEPESLVGSYLHGSAVLGCFNPARSDVDPLIVTEEPLAPNERRALERGLLARSGSPYPIEVSCLTRAQAAMSGCPWPFDFHYSEAHRETVEAGDGAPGPGLDRDLAVHVAVLLARGRTLTGEPAARVFRAPIDRDLSASIGADVLAARRSSADVYGVLNICRALAYRRGAGLLSKAEGAAWARQELPAAWLPVLEQARAAYAEGDGEPLAAEDARGLIAHVGTLLDAS